MLPTQGVSGVWVFWEPKYMTTDTDSTSRPIAGIVDTSLHVNWYWRTVQRFGNSLFHVERGCAFVSYFHPLPWLQKMNENNKATDVLMLFICSVFSFLLLHLTNSKKNVIQGIYLINKNFKIWIFVMSHRTNDQHFSVSNWDISIWITVILKTFGYKH